MTSFKFNDYITNFKILKSHKTKSYEYFLKILSVIETERLQLSYQLWKSISKIFTSWLFSRGGLHLFILLFFTHCQILKNYFVNALVNFWLLFLSCCKMFFNELYFYLRICLLRQMLRNLRSLCLSLMMLKRKIYLGSLRNLSLRRRPLLSLRYDT